MQFYSNGGTIDIENGYDDEIDVDQMDAVSMVFHLKRPNDLVLGEGDTYSIPLPSFFDGEVTGNPISVEGVQVASYDIVGSEIIITFLAAVNNLDDVTINVTISGDFKSEIFEEQNEVDVVIPYADGDSYTAIIKPAKEDYEGEDKKTAGDPYIIVDGEKEFTTDNPTHIDWTIRVNDNADHYSSATVIDDLDENLELESITVYRVFRNYKNVETLEEVSVTVNTLENGGFEIALGDIAEPYEIVYTTKTLRPEGGGKHEINNSARIILGGQEEDYDDGFEGTWDEDLPAIEKTGKLSADRADVIEWTIVYNPSFLNLGTIILTDKLDYGVIDLDSLVVKEFTLADDGSSFNYTQIEVDAELDGNEKLVISNLDAIEKAYLITFESLVPFGMKGPVSNTVSDDRPTPNTDSDSVVVDTIPKGGKVGEQWVNEDDGRPYIEWTITVNEHRVDVGSITVRDIFDELYLDFDVDDDSLFELYQDGEPANNFTIENYTHTDDSKGFKLDISPAGPHVYKFVYRTYYTVDGMQRPDLANSAELVFLPPGEGGGGVDPGVDPETGIVTPPITYNQIGPKAGIGKQGRYVLSADGLSQEIEWTIEFNQSKIKLEKPLLTETFTSGNFELISDSLEVFVVEDDVDTPFTNYTLNPLTNGFELRINEDTKETFKVTFRTTTDDEENHDHENKATLSWQGGDEKDDKSVSSRTLTGEKIANVIIDANGNKHIEWVIDFNENASVIVDVVIEDVMSPDTSAIEDLKIWRKNQDTSEYEVLDADKYTLSRPTDNSFTYTLPKLDPTPYRITYTTQLSVADEAEGVENIATFTYTGGAFEEDADVPAPSLGVQKEAIDIYKTEKSAIIPWRITANTDTENHYVTLVDAYLEDVIPADQKLVENSIKVYRAGNPNTDITDSPTINIDDDDNYFRIDLPDGPYMYYVTFDTEVLFYPSLDGTVLDKYNNSTTLYNKKVNDDESFDSVSDDAFIRYFRDGSNNKPAKTGAQNLETENIDWEAVINPLGLTIHNLWVEDTLSGSHTLLVDSIIVYDINGDPIDSTSYTVDVNANLDGFKLYFGDGAGTSDDPYDMVDYPFTIKYSTRLNPDIVGSRTVTNTIKVFGGLDGKKLEETTESTNAKQWFYGGGGSGRTLDFTLNKTSRKGTSLPDAKFTLVRIDINDGTHDVDVDVLTDEDGIYVSGSIRAGRYILTETEAPSSFEIAGNGITYFLIGYAPSDSDHEFVMTLTNSSWNPITPDPTADDTVFVVGNEITIRNNYEKIGFELTGIKYVEGRDFTAGEFNFILEDEDENEVASAKNASDGTITIEVPAIIDMPGIYTFYLREEDGGLGGIEYDDTVYTVTVHADESDDITQGLIITGVYLNDSPGDFEFNNSYSALPAEIDLATQKTLQGYPLQGKRFSFELLDEDGTVASTGINDDSGAVHFETLVFTETGEYSFTMHEVDDNQGGVTYDENSYEIKILVTDNGKGQLIASVSSYGTGDDEPPVFENSYRAKSVTAIIEAYKVLDGQDLEAGQFDFVLLNEDDDVVGEATNDINGLIEFEVGPFDEVGVYVYYIEEIQGNQGGMQYDARRFMATVEVTDAGTGQLSAMVSYISDDDDGDDETIPVFSNEYAFQEGQAFLIVHKNLIGRMIKNKEFEFQLYDKDRELVETVANDANGNVIFGPLTFEEIGEFTFFIVEVAGDDEFIDYDDSEIEVLVSVIDGREGLLVAKADYGSERPAFTNQYKPDSVEVEIGAKKVLIDMDLEDGQFEFIIRDKDGTVLHTTTNKADGTISFESLVFDNAGVYELFLAEVKGSAPDITYDDTVYSIKVTVTDDYEGQLHAEVEYDSKDMEFTNTYNDPSKIEDDDDEKDKDKDKDEIPKTGDATNHLWLAVFIASLTLLILLKGADTYMKRRRSTR